MENKKSLPPVYKEIGQNIKLLREKRGISAEQLAEQIHCSSGHLKNIESGTSGISLELLISIANALDVYIEDIIHNLLRNKRPHLESSIYDLLSDCSNEELQYYIELIKTSKNHMNYLIINKKGKK